MKSNKFPVIDFRNGRYQGATKSHLPHGVGFFIDRNFMLCLAEWVAGEISGNTIVIYPSGRIFYGQVRFGNAENIYSYELAEDHVQLITYSKPKKQNAVEMIAAILPLLRIILEIDNTDRQNARVLREYEFSLTNQQQNLASIAKILNIDRNGLKELKSYTNFIQFFKDKFLDVYPETLQFNIEQSKGKREYFMGLRGQGLGVKVQPIQQLSLDRKKTGKVYLIRAMGYFTKQNQLKDIGIKTHDNLMKGIIYEQAIFSVPQTSVKYQPGKRPINCSINFHNYIKRSLFYRDKVLETDYIYELQKYVYGFNENLRKTQTQRLAQQIIENPNNHPTVLAQIQQKRRQKEAIIQKPSKDVLNPYHPIQMKLNNPEYGLDKAKDEIYRCATKKKNVPTKARKEYKNVEYEDPNYTKIDKYQIVQPIKQVLAYHNPRYDKPIELSHNKSLSPLNRSKRSKSPYQYLDQLEQPRTAYKQNPYYLNQYLSPKKINPKYSNNVRTDKYYRSPPFIQSNRIPRTEEPAYKSILKQPILSYRNDKSSGHRPKYDYLFKENQTYQQPVHSFRL